MPDLISNLWRLDAMFDTAAIACPFRDWLLFLLEFCAVTWMILALLAVVLECRAVRKRVSDPILQARRVRNRLAVGHVKGEMTDLVPIATIKSLR